jgi:hypothetical protein
MRPTIFILGRHRHVGQDGAVFFQLSCAAGRSIPVRQSWCRVPPITVKVRVFVGRAEEYLTQSSQRAQSGNRRRKQFQSIYGARH